MPLPDDIERAIPRGSRVPWERRLLRLVEPDASPEPEPPEPDASAPLAERLAYWRAREKWAKTSAEHAEAVETLERLRSGHHQAGEPPPAPPVATPAPPPKRTRSVLVKEVLARDEAGRISKTKEYEVTEPLPEPEPPAIR